MKKTKTRKKRGWLIAVVPLLLAVNGLLLLNYFGENYASEALNRLINREIPENCRVVYESLSLDIWNRSLEVQGLHFSADTLAGRPASTKAYEVIVPAFRIKLRSVSSIFLEKELIIEGLSIIDPEISVRDRVPGEQATVTTESAGLFTVITRYLNLFEIAYLDIEDADFSYRKNWEFALEDFQFRLKQFAVDSTRARKNFFNAESVELIINDESFYLSDSTHLLSFEQVRLSTSDSTLSFQNIHLQSTSRVLDLHALDQQHPPLYNIHIPEFRLLGIDYFSTYLNNSLKIQRVELLGPDITIDSEHTPRKERTNSGDAVIDVLSRFAPAIEIGHILVQGGDIITNRLSLHIDTIDIFDLKADPENLYFTAERPPFQDFRVVAQNLHQQLNEPDQHLTVAKLRLHSREESLQLEDLSVSAMGPARDTNQLASFRVPLVQIDGIDYLRALMDSRLVMDRVDFLDPQLQLPEGQRDRPETEEQVAGPVLAALVKQLPWQTVRCDLLRLQNGSMSVGRLLNLSNYSLALQSVFLHSGVQSIGETYGALQFVGTGLNFNRPGIDFKIAGFASDGDDHVLERPIINYRKKGDEITHRSASWHILNTSIDSLLQGIYRLDSILVQAGETKINLVQDHAADTTANGPKLPASFQIGLLDISDQKLTVAWSDSAVIKVEKLNTSLQWKNNLEILALQLDTIDYHRPGNLRKVSIRNLLKEAPGESFALVDIRVGFDSLRSPVRHLSVPALKIRHLDRDQLLNEGFFSCERVELEAPDIKIDARSVPRVVSTPGFGGPQIRIGALNLEEAGLQYLGRMAEDTMRFNLPLFDLKVADIDGSTYGDISLNAHRPLYFANRFLELEARSFDIDTESGHLLTEEIALHLLGDKQNIDLKSKLLLLEGFDPEALWVDRQLVADEVFLSGLDVQLQLDTTSREEESPNSDTLNLGLTIDVGDFRLQEADCLVLHRDSLAMAGINVFATGISTDSLLPLSDIDRHFDTLSMGINDISLALGKYREYRLNQSLSYDAVAKRLTLSNVQLKPIHTKEAYSSVIDYQADHFDVEAGRVTLDHLRLGSLFERPLHLKKAGLARVRLDVYRDKNVPRLNQATPLVQGQLQKVPWPFIVDTVDVEGAISVGELAAGDSEASLISFDRLSGRLTNLTNDSARFNRPMTLKARGLLYGQGSFETEVSFPTWAIRCTVFRWTPSCRE